MEYRLKKAKDFDRVFRAGKRAFTNRLTLIYLPAKTVKAGYAVGKKHGKAVKRNRIKRLLREAFRTVLPEIGGNWFFVVIPKVSEEYTYAGYVKDLRYALKKSGLLK
ncbi:MAG: ribonuclease P protein component [Firmicutes bacterium]|mgnify:FL=1|nr:ribonuclease P protein component [Bacillota bacterium]